MNQQSEEIDFRTLLKDYTDALAYAAEARCAGWPEDNGALDPIEGLRAVLRVASGGNLVLAEADPAYPVLAKQQSALRQVMLPAADAVYHTTALDGCYRYRLHGNRGSAHIFQVAVYSGSSGGFKDYRLVSDRDNFGYSDWHANAEVDLVLSNDPADEDALELPAGPCEVMVRQYFADWDNERPGKLVLERIGAPYPAPAPGAAEIAERFKIATNFQRKMADFYRRNVQIHLDTDPGTLFAYELPEAFRGAVYLNGHYRCNESQAVVLEVKPPHSNYWSFQLSNVGGWDAMEYHLRQSSLNMHQAQLDSDGVFRAVISHRDPGVPNWLDTNGRTLGLISGRYFQAETTPTVKLTTMDFDKVGDYLPEDTAVIGTEQRQRQLHQRLYSLYARDMAE